MRLAHGFQIVEWHPDEAADQWFETRLHLAVAGCRKRGEGAAVESLVHDDDRRGFDALPVPMQSRELDGRFVGFTSRIAEEHIVHSADGREPVGKQFLIADAV